MIVIFITIVCVSQPSESVENEVKCEIHDREATEAEKQYYEDLKKEAEKPKAPTQAEIMASETTFPNISVRGGVNYFGGLRQTWYSSGVAPHMNIGDWHQDSKGFWRDSAGYIVIAYTLYLPYGTIIQLSDNCWGKVLDHCPTANTVDIYVGW